MDLFPFHPIDANQNDKYLGDKSAPGDNSCALKMAVPYSMGPAQVLALPVIVVCLAKLAYHRFNIWQTDTNIWAPGNRYAREVYKIHQHNKSIKCICTIAFSALSIIPVVGGPLGVMVITGIWRRLAIFCQKELVSAKDFTQKQFVHEFNIIYPNFKDFKLDFANYAKYSYYTRDAWPGVNLENVPGDLLNKKIYISKEGESEPIPYKIYSPPDVDYETTLSPYVF